MVFRNPLESHPRKTPILSSALSPLSGYGFQRWTAGVSENMAKQGRKRVAIYLRVSTSEQTTANQRRELKAVADRHGWTVVEVFEDAGISGGRDQRLGLDAMIHDEGRDTPRRRHGGSLVGRSTFSTFFANCSSIAWG
jgi:hypothetical protein